MIKEFFLFASSSLLFFQEVEKKHRQIKSIRHWSQGVRLCWQTRVGMTVAFHYSYSYLSNTFLCLRELLLLVPAKRFELRQGLPFMKYKYCKLNIQVRKGFLERVSQTIAATAKFLSTRREIDRVQAVIFLKKGA